MGRIRLGILTPSSNTVLEPVTSRIVADVPGASAHFARFRVVRIALSGASVRQFDPAPILDAARLLADARVDVIGWSGTSAGWLGFETDRALCAAIVQETGVPATTSVLALNEALALLGARTLGLVSPYTADVQQAIVGNYAGLGCPVVAERHLDDPGNFSFAEHGEDTLAGLVRAVAAARPDAIATFCTNLRSTGLAAGLERETGIPVLDTIATVVWKALAMAGAKPAQVQALAPAWGRIFAVQPCPAPGTAGAACT